MGKDIQFGQLNRTIQDGQDGLKKRIFMFKIAEGFF
jgi:hypothetical protein